MNSDYLNSVESSIGIRVIKGWIASAGNSAARRGFSPAIPLLAEVIADQATENAWFSTLLAGDFPLRDANSPCLQSN
jgi:hypothetical protein